MSYNVGVAVAGACFPLADSVGRSASRDSPSRTRLRLSSHLNSSALLQQVIAVSLSPNPSKKTEPSNVHWPTRMLVEL